MVWNVMALYRIVWHGMAWYGIKWYHGNEPTLMISELNLNLCNFP